MTHFLLDTAIADARAALEASPDGTLLLNSRRLIWRALGGYWMREPRADVTEGLLRRAALTYLCANKVMGLWDSVWSDADFPHKSMDAGEDYLKGNVEFLVVKRLVSSHFSRLDGDDSNEVFIYAGFAAVVAASTCLYDECLFIENDTIPDESERDFDSYEWDAAFFASAAHAGGFPWEERCNHDLLLEFWSWYLDEAILTAVEHPLRQQ